MRISQKQFRFGQKKMGGAGICFGYVRSDTGGTRPVSDRFSPTGSCPPFLFAQTASCGMKTGRYEYNTLYKPQKGAFLDKKRTFL